MFVFLFLLVRRKVLSFTMKIENSPHLIVPDPTVHDMIYGHTENDLYNFLLEGQKEPAEMFLQKGAGYWLGKEGFFIVIMSLY